MIISPNCLVRGVNEWKKKVSVQKEVKKVFASLLLTEQGIGCKGIGCRACIEKGRAI